MALAGATDKLAKTEQARVVATNDKKALELESTAIKKDIGDLEVVIQKLAQEKGARDHTIRSLNDEIANQDEIINKLNKEKKHIGEVCFYSKLLLYCYIIRYICRMLPSLLRIFSPPATRWSI